MKKRPAKSCAVTFLFILRIYMALYKFLMYSNNIFYYLNVAIFLFFTFTTDFKYFFCFFYSFIHKSYRNAFNSVFWLYEIWYITLSMLYWEPDLMQEASYYNNIHCIRRRITTIVYAVFLLLSRFSQYDTKERLS